MDCRKELVKPVAERVNDMKFERLLTEMLKNRLLQFLQIEQSIKFEKLSASFLLEAVTVTRLFCQNS